MVIEVDKDIDRYQESVAKGLTAMELSISNIVQCYKSLYSMVVSRLKILLLKETTHAYTCLLYTSGKPGK